jgi:hypothetical protein
MMDRNVNGALLGAHRNSIKRYQRLLRRSSATTSRNGSQRTRAPVKALIGPEDFGLAAPIEPYVCRSSLD